MGSGTWFTIADFASAIDANLDRWLGDRFRLGLSEYRALTLLRSAPAHELRITELARQIGLTSNSTTRLVIRLESKGHARREACEDDGRGVYAKITPRGATLLDEIQPPFEDHLQAILTDPTAHLPQFNADQLGAALGHLHGLVTHT